MITLEAKDFFPSPAEMVAVVKRAPQEPFPEHAHDFGEIVIVSQGGGYNVVNDYARRVCAGSVFYLMPDDRHSFEDLNDLCLTNVMFRMPERYRALLQVEESVRCKESWEIGSDTRREVERLLNGISMASQGFPLDLARSCYLEGVFLQLVALLCQARYSCNANASLDTRARELVSYLQGNFSELIDWEGVAEKFGLSVRSMHRKIVDQTGLTPMRYLTQIRLSHAARQLVQTRQSITDIAFASGFDDSNYFATLFRQAYACTPSQYRAQHAAWVS
jgi:AraC family transcriptional regulator, L-rhamnose operon regulatory protein RhaS